MQLKPRRARLGYLDYRHSARFQNIVEALSHERGETGSTCEIKGNADNGDNEPSILLSATTSNHIVFFLLFAFCCVSMINNEIYSTVFAANFINYTTCFGHNGAIFRCFPLYIINLLNCNVSFIYCHLHT
jgi:hypothetical protein